MGGLNFWAFGLISRLVARFFFLFLTHPLLGLHQRKPDFPPSTFQGRLPWPWDRLEAAIQSCAGVRLARGGLHAQFPLITYQQYSDVDRKLRSISLPLFEDGQSIISPSFSKNDQIIISPSFSKNDESIISPSSEFFSNDQSISLSNELDNSLWPDFPPCFPTICDNFNNIDEFWLPSAELPIVSDFFDRSLHTPIVLEELYNFPVIQIPDGSHQPELLHVSSSYEAHRVASASSNPTGSPTSSPSTSLECTWPTCEKIFPNRTTYK